MHLRTLASSGCCDGVNFAKTRSDAVRGRPVSAMKSGFCLQRSAAGALCALVLLLGTVWPIAAADAKHLTAIFLSARGELADSNFADSVVLVMNNLGPAPIGVIINRPTQIPVARLFPDLKSLAQLPDKVYFGGPVDFGSVWFLFRAGKAPKHAIQAFDGICLSANRDLLRQLLGRDKPMEGLRIFVGHSGWAPGQLEAEIAQGVWTLEQAEADTIFKGKSEHPWPAPRSPKDST
jgi:putative transcriptional regulator